MTGGRKILHLVARIFVSVAATTGLIIAIVLLDDFSIYWVLPVILLFIVNLYLYLKSC